MRGINSVIEYRCDDMAIVYAAMDEARALLAQPAAVETAKPLARLAEHEIADMCEKAGLWPNSCRSWIHAFHRYNDQLLKRYAAPLPDVAQGEAVKPKAIGRVFVDQFTGKRSAVLGNGSQDLPDMALIYAAPVAHSDVRDAARFRWLTEDHADSAVREQCRSILSSMGMLSYSAACMSIDANMKSAPSAQAAEEK